jgi:hypothetical protein
MTSTTKNTSKKVEATKTKFVANLKTPAIVRKGFRAYVGVFGAAYEAALPRYEKAVKNATKSYDDYAARGEKIETAATCYAKDTRKNVTSFAKARFEKRSAQLRSIVPGTAKGRVVELEAEIAKLNKKIVSLGKTKAKSASKKATKVATTVTSKTAKAA